MKNHVSKSASFIIIAHVHLIRYRFFCLFVFLNLIVFSVVLHGFMACCTTDQ